MKSLFAILFVLSVTPAFAVDFECTKQTSTTRTESATISSWPHLMVSTSFRECSSNDGSGFCRAGTLEEIASPYRLCYTNIDVAQDCTVNESASSVEAACTNGSKMSFSMDSDSKGQIVCSEHGVVRKTWNVGACTAK